jgi:dihydrofolate reductase
MTDDADIHHELAPPARDVVLQISSISLDGFIALDGTPFDEQASRLVDPVRDQWMVDSINRAGVHIMGRVTYEAMASWWPTSTEVFAEPMNRIPKVVFSRSLQSAPWGDDTRIVRGDVATEIAALKGDQRSGEVLAHGGALFDQSLAAADLVDEYRLIVYPFVIGSGTALFHGVTAPRHLELSQTVEFPSGCVAMVYRRR